MTDKAPRVSSRRTVATWEHIINDARIVTRENIALCCASCNSSKGQQLLAVWLRSERSIKRGISEATIAPIIGAALTPSGDAQPTLQADVHASAALRRGLGLS